jgi:hypothetical protein
MNLKNRVMRFVAICKNIFSLQLFFGWSFGFSFPIWFVELGKTLLQHFKSFKMEKTISCNITHTHTHTHTHTRISIHKVNASNGCLEWEPKIIMIGIITKSMIGW